MDIKDFYVPMVFSTPFETGCVSIGLPDETGMFTAYDSQGVECLFSLDMVTEVGLPKKKGETDKDVTSRIRHQAENPTNYDEDANPDPVDLFRKRYDAGEVDVNEIAGLRKKADKWDVTLEQAIRRLADEEYDRDNPDVTLI